MPKVRVSKPAQADLDEIWLYIAQDSVEAANRFIDHLTNRFPLIAEFPEMGRSREDLSAGLRGFPVKNYTIFYRPRKGGIEIIRVLHGARDIPSFFL